MTARPAYPPARIWAVHGLGFLAGLGAMAGVVWLALAGIALLALLLTGGGLMGAVLGLDADPATSGMAALGALFPAGGVALGGMGGEA